MMELHSAFEKEVEIFVRVCRRLYSKGFVTSHGGNCAWKVDDDIIMITATCLNKGEHTPEDVVFINRQGEKLEGTREPTGEVPMYTHFFCERPDISSIIHCHPPCACACCISAEDDLLMMPVFPEVVLEVGPVPCVPYAAPLTEKLAHSFDPYLKKYNAFLMENHGLLLVTSRGIEWAWNLVEELECAADSILRARAAGDIKTLSREEIEEMDDIISVRNLPRCGAPGENSSLADLYRTEM